MRNLSLVTKLWLSLSLLVLFVLVPMEYALDEVLERFYSAQVTEPLLYHSNQLASMLAIQDDAVLAAPLMAKMVGGEVVVLDHTGHSRLFEGASAITPPEDAVEAVMSKRIFVGQTETADGREFIVTGVPIPGGRGAVLLMSPADPLQQSLNLARRYLLLAGGVTLLLGTGLALVVARGLTRPILAMEKATRSVAEGDFSVRVEVDSADETGRLGQAINQMTAQLETFETRRREFLANVAHELRTPLSYIRGYTQAMAEGIVTDPAEVARYQRVVLDETVRVGRLVDDLLDLAQMDEGQLAFDLLPLDLSLPIQQAATIIRPRAEERGVALIVDLPGDLPTVLADGGRIQQVVINLVDNALRHTSAGGQVRVEAQAHPTAIAVRVMDTGEGIDPGMLPVVFDRFQGRRSGGRGLGLAVVRSIIRGHGGEVGVESKPGEGATFWFSLPRQ